MANFDVSARTFIPLLSAHQAVGFVSTPGRKSAPMKTMERNKDERSERQERPGHILMMCQIRGLVDRADAHCMIRIPPIQNIPKGTILCPNKASCAKPKMSGGLK